MIAQGKADASGAFKVKINKQKEYAVLYVSASADDHRESGDVKMTVADVIPPGAPKVYQVSDKSTVIQGKTEARRRKNRSGIGSYLSGQHVQTASRRPAYRIRIFPDGKSDENGARILDRGC